MAAADALSGRNVWVGIGKQAAFGTPVAPTKFFEVTDLGGLMPKYDWKKSDRRVGTRFKPLGTKTGKKVPFNFSGEVNAENIGLLLMLAMGSDASTADGSAYKHTASLAENLTYFTLWVNTDNVADDNATDTIHQIPNCKLSSLKLDGTVDDVLKFTVEGVGTDRVPAFTSKTSITASGTTGNANITGLASTLGIVPGMTVTGTNIGAAAKVLSVAATSLVLTVNNTGTVTAINVASPTPTFPTSRSLHMKAEEGQAKIEIGADVGSLAQFDETVEFHFSITNGVAPDMRLDNTAAAAALREGDSEMTGSMKAVYNRNTFVEIKAFIAGTVRAIRFTATSVETAATGKPFKLVFTTDKARYSDTPASWDPDTIATDCPFEVEKTTSYPIIEVTNADASAY